MSGREGSAPGAAAPRGSRALPSARSAPEAAGRGRPGRSPAHSRAPIGSAAALRGRASRAGGRWRPPPVGLHPPRAAPCPARPHRRGRPTRRLSPSRRWLLAFLRGCLAQPGTSPFCPPLLAKPGSAEALLAPRPSPLGGRAARCVRWAVPGVVPAPRLSRRRSPNCSRACRDPHRRGCRRQRLHHSCCLVLGAVASLAWLMML